MGFSIKCRLAKIKRMSAKIQLILFMVGGGVILESEKVTPREVARIEIKATSKDVRKCKILMKSTKLIKMIEGRRKHSSINPDILIGRSSVKEGMLD
jgi:hypothetical protein